MHSVSMPAIDLLSTIPQVLAVEAEVRANCELAFARLWSWTARYGNGPHPAAAIERVVRWDGDGGVFTRALVATGWADEADGGGVIIRPWQDVLGYADPVPANETPEERRRRQIRESVRRHRQAKQQEKLHPELRKHDENIGKQTENIGKHPVNSGKQIENIGKHSVNICKQETPSSRARSLSLSSSLQKEERSEAEAEEENVGSIAFVPVTPASPAGIGAAPRSTPREAIDGRLPFALTPSEATDRTTAIGQERPAVAIGSTIGAEVRSVPVPASDRATEANSGVPAKKPRGGKKAAIDPAVVDEPVRQVWNAYAEVVGTRVVLSQERAALIAARLSDGWTAEELIEAVRGFGKSKWHFGANKEGTRYTSIELWLRDAQHVEQGLGFHKEAAKPAVDPAEALKNPPRTGIEDRFKAYFAKHGNKVVF